MTRRRVNESLGKELIMHSNSWAVLCRVRVIAPPCEEIISWIASMGSKPGIAS